MKLSGDKLKIEFKENKLAGYTESFYVTKNDAMFMIAVQEFCKYKDINLSTFIMTAIKVYTLIGEETLREFKEIYQQVVDENANLLTLRYRGFERTLNDILHDEFVVNDFKVKL